jgi:hypothetical protein
VILAGKNKTDKGTATVFMMQMSLFCDILRYYQRKTYILMKSRFEQGDSKQHWISNKAKKSRELVYKLIDMNKEITSEGTYFRLGDKRYFVRELG